nr:F-box domain, leucine-rich repeat domain, L domain-like protein [Tanacetum cinerariifolium]
MRRLKATGTYTDDEINRLARGGKQRRHIPGVGRVLPARGTTNPSTPAHESTLNSLHKKMDIMMSLFKSDSKYSDMFSKFESVGASGSDGCGDDEESADDQDDEDEDGDKDEITFGNASLFRRPSTPSISSSSASSSSRPSEAALSLGNTKCSNCKLLTMKIKILEARLAMERHPEDHTCQSAAIVQELLNEMENLHVE